MPHSLVSVHPSVLAALLEDAKAGETEASDAPPAAAVAAWLVGLSLRDRENGNVSTTRVVGVVRCSCPPRPLAEDLGAFFFFFSLPFCPFHPSVPPVDIALSLSLFSLSC